MGVTFYRVKNLSYILIDEFFTDGEFTGGGFRFPSQDIEIEAVHNRTVVFPSCVLHQALPVYGSGARISIAQFVGRIE